MNIKNLILSQLNLVLILIGLLGFIQCEQRKPESNQPEDNNTFNSDDKSILRYQLFNLELAIEEAYHIQNTNKNSEAQTLNRASYIVAIKQLKDPCDFNCDPIDYKCLLKYIDCKETTEIVYRSSLSNDDGDGSDPLPPASDTSLFYAVDLTEMVIFSDDPETSEFKLITNEGHVYATNDISPKNFRYDREKRHAVYKIQVRNPELASKPLTIHMSTMIINASGVKRVIELNQPFSLEFRK